MYYTTAHLAQLVTSVNIALLVIACCERSVVLNAIESLALDCAGPRAPLIPRRRGRSLSWKRPAGHGACSKVPLLNALPYTTNHSTTLATALSIISCLIVSSALRCELYACPTRHGRS